MHKFFVEDGQIIDGNIHIYKEDASHIYKSLRMKTGEQIQVSNGKGREFIIELKALSKDEVVGKIKNEFNNFTELELNITLYQGISKGSKMDYIIQKSVELGVSRIIPIITERTIVDVENKGNKKIERWQRIALEAAKQSKRGKIPIIEEILSIKELENNFSKNELNLIAYEGEENSSLKDKLNNYPNILDMGILIGPEGGISKDEIELLTSIGGQPITLGKRILRTETAGLAMVSMVTYHYEL